MARADSPVKSLALKGKTIAVNAVNSEVTDLLYNALAADHITPGQVHLAQIPFPAMAAALATGRVDAAYMTEPYVTEAGQKNGDLLRRSRNARTTRVTARSQSNGLVRDGPYARAILHDHEKGGYRAARVAWRKRSRVGSEKRTL
jgi:ABC-type taurine transport system substrate-binding protein